MKSCPRNMLLLLTILVSGCSGFRYLFNPLPPITHEEIIRLTQENVSPEQIIQKIKETNTVFRPNSDEITGLRQQGVEARVVDYMMNTYIEQVRRYQRLEDWHRWHLYQGHYYWWPPYDRYWHFIRHPSPKPTTRVQK